MNSDTHPYSNVKYEFDDDICIHILSESVIYEFINIMVTELLGEFITSMMSLRVVKYACQLYMDLKPGFNYKTLFLFWVP